MAHEIETYDNGETTQAAAVFARVDAWHRLGTTVRGAAFTAEHAMQLGHLGGWNVRTVPLTTTEITPDGVTTMTAPGYATVRTNPFTRAREALGVVGLGYVPLQNEDHAEFLNRLADESGAIFDTAGSLRGGRQVFITMKLPNTLRIGGSDRVDLNIAALNSHDGSAAFRLLITPIRVVCANTQTAALRCHEASLSIRHTRNARQMVQRAREALGLTWAYLDEFEAEAERMIQTTLTEGAFNELVSDLFPEAGDPRSPVGPPKQRERRDTLTGLFLDADTQAGIRGTAWAGYQAVAEYVDHFAPVRANVHAADARAVRLLSSAEPARIKRRAWAALAAR